MTGNKDKDQTKRRVLTHLELEKQTGVKKPLGIKVDATTDERLKIARSMSKEHGASFNVSLHLEKHLVVLLDMLEKQLGYNHEDYKMEGRKAVKK
ncbi:hypothetical protein P7F88_25275 [Vibrio hannami]|uniref:hypothetical protein n=1 Tax=Vibrio hannami TaxID=2717094 RepID=UPI0024103D5E|nr:hypothetical protein [Vibrio hannami]MDG3089177.1 hypothetical protein [Vibrio hannami]